MSELDISIIANVSISTPPATLGFYNPNSLMIITADTALGDLGYNSYGLYKDLNSVGTDWGTTTNTYKMAQAIFAQSPNILSAGGYLMIAPKQSSETLAQAITRMSGVVYFAGVISSIVETDENYEAAATVVQGLDTILFVPTNNSDAFEASGLFETLSDAKDYHCKPIYYGAGTNVEAVCFGAAYASRSMCVDFTAQNSTLTMNLKDISGFVADDTITTTLQTQASGYGVDIYPSIGGLAKVLSYPVAGLYFDDVYNQIWFKKRAQVEFFNALAGTRNKIPQTEVGMNYLKNAVVRVCQLGVYNGFLAPGTWNSADTFGNPDDFRRNIQEFGYYVYSAPITSQSQTDRQARKAPVIQVAAKEAGAIHSGSIILNFEQ